MAPGKDVEDEGASSPLDELRDRVHRATTLISQLREANQAMRGELAELKRRLEEKGAPAGPSDAAELEYLREERSKVRAKVQTLLERLEKLA